MNKKILWEGADDSWRGRIKSVWAQMKLLWRGWWGRKVPPARPVQEELPARNFPQKATKGTEDFLRRFHHSRGKRDARGQN